MKRDVTKPILTIKGKHVLEAETDDRDEPIMVPVLDKTGAPVLNPDKSPRMEPKTVPVTLRTVLVNALQGRLTQEQSYSSSQKREKAIKRIELARKIMANDVVDMTASEIDDCLNLVSEQFQPIVIAQVSEMLNTDYIEPATRRVEMALPEATIND